MTTATTFGRERERPLPLRREQPLGGQLRLELLELDREVPHPAGLDRVDVQLQRALRLVHVDAPVRDDAKPGLGLERRANAFVPEPDALELGAVVLQREVGVAGARDRDPADLALDPQVPQLVVRADGRGDRPRSLADGQDPEALERLSRRASWPNPRCWHDTGIRYRRVPMDVDQFQSAIEIAVSIAVLLAPVPFLVAVVVGAFVLSSRGRLGGLGTAVVSFTGGLMLGTMLLVDADLLRLRATARRSSRSSSGAGGLGDAGRPAGCSSARRCRGRSSTA